MSDMKVCDWCQGPVDPADIDDSNHEAGASKKLVWCSDVCRQIVVEGKWPSPVGPASHDEMVVWIQEAEREANPPRGGLDPSSAI